jgi:predicted acetyltransferase
MIQFADDQTKPQVWDMWKTVFGDSDEYMELYFRHKYRHDQTLLYMEGEKAVSSLQMLPYWFSFCGKEIPVLYLMGVCTLPEARRRGYTKQLLLRSFEIAKERDIPLILLVPQEEWLFHFYGKYDFVQTFDAGKEPLPSLKEIISQYPDNLQHAYRAFDRIFRQQDMTVQKTLSDFQAIVEEAALFQYPSIKNLNGMARTINARQLCQLFAEHYSEKSCTLEVSDKLIKENNITLTLSDGEANLNNSTQHSAIQIEIGELTQCLLGYHTSEMKEPFRTLFPEKQPAMHFMLE